jgi:selenocysteine lyase/cysteine desulfurase
VSFDAQQRAWLEAAERLDFKWERIFGELLPRAQEHVARVLSLSDPSAIAFGPNTHDFLMRIVSCLPPGTIRVLTSDSEFHSFTRQSRRLEESGRMAVERVKTEPFPTFAERFLERAASREHDLVYVSQVFFNSGFLFEDFRDVAPAAREDALVVIDGYHGFFAVPTDLADLEHRVFYLAGGYKYAMSGEGVCFLHCPPGFGERPVDTGWYAGFGKLESGEGRGTVEYAKDGTRFLGATFDPGGLYRFDAVMDLWHREGVDVPAIHAHALALERRFLERLDGLGARELHSGRLVPDRSFAERGHFLTFRQSDAERLHARLREQGVVTDWRGERIRFGFGVYQDERDVDELGERLGDLLG